VPGGELPDPGQKGIGRGRDRLRTQTHREMSSTR
jgi:hypothetical protein